MFRLPSTKPSPVNNRTVGAATRGLWHARDGNQPNMESWLPDGEDYVRLKTVGRGQEFVLDSIFYPEAIDWASELFGLNHP